MLPSLFIADSFTTRRFAGNPAAVVLFDEKPADDILPTIASELNAPATAFPIPSEAGATFKDASSFDLRWFATKNELPLCGHATLATAHVIFNEIGNINEEITLKTRQAGILRIKKIGKAVEMNFPSQQITSIREASKQYDSIFPNFDAPSRLNELIRSVIHDTVELVSVAYAPNAKLLMLVMSPETTSDEFAAIKPDFSRILELEPNDAFVKGIFITFSPTKPKENGWMDDEGEPYDYLCRCFIPWYGINEDPATGSAQCALAPFWSKVLGKSQLYAYQAFPGRGAHFRLSVWDGDRIAITGNAVTAVEGQLHYPSRSV